MSASCALAWMTPALSRISSAVRSWRNASAPACIEIWEIRWARTSCISRAIRSRSLLRDWAARSSCSDSARSARWRSVHSSSRRDPMYMPHASMAAVAIALTLSRSHIGSSSELGCQVTKNCAAAKPTEPTNAISRHRRRVATETDASMAAPLAMPLAAQNRETATATGTGQRRRNPKTST